jgi:uncharacterized membrane protein
MGPDAFDQKATADRLRRLAQGGGLSSTALERGLRIAGILPDGRAWSRFINALLLLLGAILVVSGVIFFFAYNWTAMSTFSKFGVVEGALVIAIAISLFSGIDSMAGKTAILTASLFVGALLALYGQTYQTGADAYELFLGWAALIAGWVFIGNFSPLWLLLLVLMETSFLLYWGQVEEPEWLFFRSAEMFEVLFLINVAALAAWEWASSRGVSWLSGRWIPRLIASTGLTSLVIPLLILIFDHGSFVKEYSAFSAALLPALYVLAVAFVLWFYQRGTYDLYMIAAALLSLIVVITAFFADALGNNSGGFLFLSIVIIALSAGAAAWLRNIARARSTEAP